MKAAGRKDFMENLWLKIKIWTKILLFSIVVIYLGIFIYNNSDQPLTIWVWFGKEFRTSALEMIPAMLLAGVFGTVVVRMAFRAVKQIRELKQRNASARMQKDMADIKAKAAMLQTTPPPTPEAAKNPQ
jgi:Trk-type K+ transport system membrane component